MVTEEIASWKRLVHFIVATVGFYSLAVAVLFFTDPYGRSGIRPSAKISDLPERLLLVSRAMDPAFNSAIVGNSTSIPMQPEVLDGLTRKHFVSLSMSGSASGGALATARFFLRRHPAAKTMIIAMDDSWCTKGSDVDEPHDFPFWLYGSDLEYLIGLTSHASLEFLKTAYAEAGSNRLDGYHPYDEVFRTHDFDNIDVVKARLNRITRPTTARYSIPYRFEPPESLRALITETPPNVTFVLFWTPRFLSLQPIEGTTAAEADTSCKRQAAELMAPNVRIVDWSGLRPENLDPSNFYEPNHYRDGMALKIEREIAAALH